MRVYIFFRQLFEVDGADAIGEDGNIPANAEAQNNQTAAGMVIENIPMLYAKFYDMYRSKSTTSFYWSLMFLLGLNSTIKAV